VWAEEDSEVKREKLYAAVNESVARSPVGSRGLLFFPLAGGHTSDLGLGRGGFVGLSLSHSRGDMARAVMEGTVFELRWLLDEVRDAGVGVSALKMVGGAAQSPVWPQIVADGCGVPVTVPTEKQAASRGAAILAGVGAGLFEDPEAGFQAFRGEEQRLKPVPENAARYDELYESYRRLFQAVAGELKTLDS
jgi:xylulokinase